MRPVEYQRMAEVEATHWWYRGLRDAIGRCLDRPGLRLPPAPRVLDAGCGTGATLRWLGERYAPSYLGGFDASDEALSRARRKAPSADLYRSDLCDPEIRADALDLVVSLDVLPATGADASLGGLQRMVERLAPGGLLVLNLPAYAWLRSEHDAAVGQRERFTAGKVHSMLGVLGLEPARLTYRLCALLPLVVLWRLAGKARLRRRGSAGARSDLHAVPRRAVDQVLFRIVAAENRLIAHGVPLPWGSSVFAIGRRA